MPAIVDLPEPETPTIETKDLGAIVISIPFNMVLLESYEKERFSSDIFISLSLISLLPLCCSGRSRNANIRSLDFIPFIPIWKKLPKIRIGRKNSAARNKIISIPKREISAL